MKCDYCGIESEIFFIFKSGKICCKKFVTQCPEVRNKNSTKNSTKNSNNSESLKKQYADGLRISHFKTYNDGSVWLGRKHSEKTKLILKEKFCGKKMTDEFRSRRSEEMKERYASGWEASAGRTKKISYHSDIAGDIKIDGSWELAVCKYFDKEKINWKRNTSRFDYLDSDNKKRTYCPDFYLVDIDTFIEVKGFITQLDKIKWSQFIHKLEIWDEKVLKDKKILGG